ncbi:ABC transporter [Betaentomopoxvirus amoorei]|uniref:AMV130 n=1 Tax=Amsacta moorei entomopoxvirus TaxID=28321 RepID=Q9EMR9_AMEPV|nr:ABC transporter [Amsacta moorei entomopoxvirus]AAG02836.1 AMV130 [Amsacta moorei entomopoxvirus]
MYFNILNGLLWKYYIIKRKKYIYDMLEYLLLILFFTLLYSFKKNIKYYDNDLNNINKINNNTNIIYYPKSNISIKIIENVAKELKINKYYGSSNENEIINFIDTNETIFILFNNTCENLLYTIRFNNNENNDRLLINIQWLINMNYLRLLSNKNINIDIDINEYIYKNFNTNILFYTYYSILIIAFISFILKNNNDNNDPMFKIIKVPKILIYISNFICSIPFGIIYSVFGTIILTISEDPLINNNNNIIMFLILLIYFISVISMAYLCNFFILLIYKYKIFVIMCVYVLTIIPITLYNNLNSDINIFIGLIPHIPLYWIFDQLNYVEKQNKSLTFNNINISYSIYSKSILISIIYLILQSFIYISIIHIIKLIYKICKKYMKMKYIYIINENNNYMLETENNDYYVKIQNIYKYYDNNFILNNICLDIIKNNTTVLLGNNSAGKSTLLSIIFGLIKPNKGKILTNNIKIGYCPQNNINFTDFTVKENIYLFNILRGLSSLQSKIKTNEIIIYLKLHDIENCIITELSECSKRKLQLAFSLIDDSDFILIDEPTHNIDLKSKQEIWDLISLLKRNKTILITTHCIDEVELLADNLIILNNGNVKYNSTLFNIKKDANVTYKLSIHNNSTDDKIKNIIINSGFIILNINKIDENNSIYNIYKTENSNFLKLFELLENVNCDIIYFKSNTLNDILYKLCSEDIIIPDDSYINNLNYNDMFISEIMGFNKIMRQFIELFKRNIYYIRKNILLFVIINFILSILIVYVGIVYIKKYENLYLYNFVIINHNIDNFINNSNYLLDIKHNSTYNKITYIPLFKYSGSIAINIISNIIAKINIPNIEKDIITTIFYPMYQNKTSILTNLFISIILQLYCINYNKLIKKDNINKTRKQHIINGCNPELHWITTLLFNMILFSISVIPIILYMLNIKSFFDLIILYFILIINALSFMLFSIIILMFDNQSDKIILILVFILGILLPIYKIKYKNIILDILSYIFIPSCISMSIIEYLNTHKLNYIISIIIQILLYLILIILIERGLIDIIYNKIINLKYNRKNNNYFELQNINKYTDYNSSLIMSNVYKIYNNKLALNNINFKISEGKCFGIIGGNGCGKSTIFKILSGEECVTKGNIYIGCSNRSWILKSNYFKKISYCSQFFGIDTFLTGRQNLKLIMILNGFSDKHIQYYINIWLKLLNIEKYADKAVYTYSTGIIKRLKIAMSLAPRSILTLMDEPTSGIDIVSKQIIWKTIKYIINYNYYNYYKHSILISSNNIEEIEYLCSNVIILDSGNIMYNDTLENIKNIHSTKIINIKLLHYDNNKICKIKNKLKNKGFMLKSDNKFKLTFCVSKNINLKYSELFKILYILKNNYSDIIDQYDISDTNIEQLFS